MSERILARHDMHRRTYWPSTRTSSSSGTHCTPGVFPTLSKSDRVEPVAAAVTALAAFAETAGMAAVDAEFDAETEDCFALFVEIKGEDL